MADMDFWRELYSTLLTKEKAEALQQRFEEALLKQIEAWSQKIFNGIKKEILQKAQTGEFTFVGRTRYLEGEYGELCGDFTFDSAFYAVLLEMEKTALLKKYCELRCTVLPDGNKRLHFDGLRRNDGRIYRLGQFGTVFSKRIEELCSNEWINVGIMPIRVARRNAKNHECTEMRVYYTVSI
ncbi:MAG: hypothetical protein E7590_06135 [Ruminococcaceae bacterium]|nr:hypothetical protein [Oscillospiraceae bacterium]MBE6703498.1 hypothetical protein [Oscillospiraceae bacterium]